MAPSEPAPGPDGSPGDASGGDHAGRDGGCPHGPMAAWCLDHRRAVLGAWVLFGLSCVFGSFVLGDVRVLTVFEPA